MSAKASPTAAAAPAERREQPAASSAIAHASMANAIRALAMDAVEQAKSGHPGMPMGMADVATVLFTRFLKFDPAEPRLARPRPLRAVGRPRLDAVVRSALPDRLRSDDDRADQALPAARLDHRRLIRNTATRRASRPPPARSARASPMRSAWRLPNNISLRIRRRHRRSQHLRARLRRRPDGRHQPGSDRARRPSEAQQADRVVRRQRHLDRRRVSLADSVDQVKRFEAAGWSAARIDGHDPEAIASAMRIGAEFRPAGADRLQDHHRIRRADQGRQASSHGSPLGADEITGAREKLGWTPAPFEVPADILTPGAPPAARRGSAHATGTSGWARRRRQARRIRTPHAGDMPNRRSPPPCAR